MKMGDNMFALIKLAYSNLKKYKKTYRICTICIIISTFMILFFLSLFQGCNYIVNNELQKIYEFREITILSNQALSENDQIKGEKNFTLSDINLLKDSDKIKSFTIMLRTEIPILRCFIDNIEIAPPDYLTGINVNYDTFSNARVESCKIEDNKFAPIIAGRDFVQGDKNCAIIDESSAYMYGVQKIEDIINKQIHIYVDENRKIDVNIIGVYSSHLGSNLFSEELTNSQFYTPDGLLDISSEYILLSSDVVFSINNESEYMQSITDFSEITVAVSDISATIDIFELLSTRYDNQINCDAESINNSLEYLRLFSNVFIFLGFLLLLLTAFNIYSVIILTAEKRKKWFCLQNVLGFRKKQISLCYIFEISFAVLKGYTICIMGITVLCFVLNKIIIDVYSEYMSGNTVIFLPPIAASIFLLLFIFLFILMISIIITNRIYKLDVIKTLCKN